jgi:hypothetical protein
VKNPFELVTASKLGAAEALELWCDDHRLARVAGRENCFVNGHRGTGKSMLFRILQYDCQKLLHPKNSPDFLAVYFSVRDTEFLTEEFDLFQDDAQKNIISESHFSLLLAKQICSLLKSDSSIMGGVNFGEFSKRISTCLATAYQYSDASAPELQSGQLDALLDQIVSILEKERARIVNYVGLRLYDRTPFKGPLFLFDTLLGPIGDFLMEQTKRCLYVLVDDGDDLPESHTIVLNTWIARRRASVVFKVSTMFGYKTFRTRTRSAIQNLHDFFHYDIATRYMSDKAEDYVQLLRDICTKRLKNAGIETSPGRSDPDEFFPEDQKQKEALAELEASLQKEYERKYKGRAIRDHVYRHLTSEYLQFLGDRHALGSFTYSGFQTLATLSSGLVRDFIICAQRMFDSASRTQEVVRQIPPSLQNDVVRNHANLVLEEIANPRQKRAQNATREDWQKVYRLAEGLGHIFKLKMLSKDSERRVFSFAFQNEPGEEVERLLNLAVAEGYLMKGFISKKEGTGRRVLYVLTRRLAPAFNLDVSAYSGYLSLRVERIGELMRDGASRLDAASSSSQEFPLFALADGSADDVPGDEQWAIISPEEAGI